MQTVEFGKYFAMATLTLLLPLNATAQAPAPLPQDSPYAGAAGQANGGQTNTSSAVEPAPQGSSPVSPIVGAKEFGLGSTGESQSYFIPSFQYTGYADTNPGFTGSGEKRILQSTYVGSITLQKVTRETQFNLNYAGGAEFYNRLLTPTPTSGGSSYGTFHQLGLGESVNWRRWQLFLGDEGSYLPESPGGFTGFGGLQSFNAGLGGSALSTGGSMNGLLQPSQSILGAFARRLSNTSISQLQYAATARTTFAVTGAYGVLNFLDSGFTDDEYFSLLASGTHAFSPGNSVSVTYLHTLIHFHSPHQDILDRGLILSYGHKILGRLAFETSAGYLLDQFAIPTGGSVTQGFITTYDSLQYRWRRSDFRASFNRNITDGSGILRGAETDLLEGSVGRQFFRTTYLSLDFGHAYNQSLSQAMANRRAKAETWEGGIHLSRELGSHLSFYIQYNVQRQTANASLCTPSGCGVTFFRQTGGIGMNWHTRPMRLP